MRYGTSLLALLFVLSVGAAPLAAQGRGNGHAKKAAPTQTAKAKPVKAPKVESNKSPKVKADNAPKIKADKAPKVKTVAGTPTASVTPMTPVTPTTPTTQHVKNPKLEARLMALLPNLAPGTTIQDVSGGFKNWGQFVAAVHVSNNLGIPFADLKARMTGMPVPGMTPGLVVRTTPLSLGQAIQSFKTTTPVTPTTPTTSTTPTLTQTQIRNEVKKAEDAANADLRRTRDSN
jgi:hypothetical protein